MGTSARRLAEMSIGPSGTGCDAAGLAAVMLRLVPSAAPCLWLEITTGEGGSWLRLTYPATRSWPAAAATALSEALTVIDAATQHWGHHGYTHDGTVWHTVWAVLAPASGSPAAPPTAAIRSGQPTFVRNDPPANHPSFADPKPLTP
jgi:hypothetical protein